MLKKYPGAKGEQCGLPVDLEMIGEHALCDQCWRVEYGLLTWDEADQIYGRIGIADAIRAPPVAAVK